jgi:hypothetical protein
VTVAVLKTKRDGTILIIHLIIPPKVTGIRVEFPLGA